MFNDHEARPTLYPAVRGLESCGHTPVPWFWPGRIPAGKLTLLIGEPGVGKSLLLADLAARASANRPWPDNPPPDPAFVRQYENTADIAARYPPHFGSVLIASAEDDLSDTIYPRLVAAGADLKLVHFLTGVTETFCGHRTAAFYLSQHIGQLGQAVRGLDNPTLVILDTLPALLAPRLDFARNPTPHLPSAAFASIAAALTDIAETYSVAIVATTHLSRDRGLKPLLRARGALAFAATARAALFVTHDPVDPARRILTPLKNTLAAQAPPLAFRIETVSDNDPIAPIDHPRVAWESTPPRPLDDHLLEIHAETRHALLEACQWLTTTLKTGPRPAREILRESREALISRSSLKRAKRAMGVRSFKTDNDTGWLWVLSDNQQPHREGSAGVPPAFLRALCASLAATPRTGARASRYRAFRHAATRSSPAPAGTRTSAGRATSARSAPPTAARRGRRTWRR